MVKLESLYRFSLFVDLVRSNYGGRVVAPQKIISAAVPKRGRIGTDSVVKDANLAKLLLKGSLSSARMSGRVCGRKTDEPSYSDGI